MYGGIHNEYVGGVQRYMLGTAPSANCLSYDAAWLCMHRISYDATNATRPAGRPLASLARDDSKADSNDRASVELEGSRVQRCHTSRSFLYYESSIRTSGSHEGYARRSRLRCLCRRIDRSYLPAPTTRQAALGYGASRLRSSSRGDDPCPTWSTSPGKDPTSERRIDRYVLSCGTCSSVQLVCHAAWSHAGRHR